MYKKVSSKLNFVEREENILKFWKENNIFEKSIKNRENSDTFTFYEGPPTANGKPHIGHIITRAYKDLLPRYKTMKGYKVLRKGGWDTHGLPVELEVEKELKINGKPAIEKYGVEPFVQRCRESVFKYETLWRDVTERTGFWLDMDNPYKTYDNNYIESVWWSLKTLYDKDLLYKGHKVVPYCPRCGTSLSSHEVAQGYKDVKEASVIAKFKLKSEDSYFLAWTTTPWTLPSNVGLCVNPNEKYAKIKFENEVYILAEDLIENVLGEDAIYEKLDIKLGKDLEHLEYVPIFNFANITKNAFFVTCDDYVTLTDGTGIVHTAPAFGEDDARVGKNYNLPFLQLVNEQGKFTEEVTPYKDIFVKDADLQIIIDIKKAGLLFKKINYEHSYPFCWRCHTALIYYARDTWFISMTKLRDNLVKNNSTVNWLPDNIKEGRFGKFLENVVDWGLSRERYWGTPLPIWLCENGHLHVVGSIEELKENSKTELVDIDLHKPYIDNVVLCCKECGKDMHRTKEVIDCWYDSGSMPFAQLHYPFENKEVFDENFPADFISEAIDQTRGWFYSLIAISTALFDVAPYKNVIVLGHVQDANGKKMSKHIGNVVDPWDALTTQGADATRWYFYVNSSPWLPSKFSEEYVAEAQRKFIGTYWNTYAFYILYANIDKFNPSEHKLDYKLLSELDKWILSKLNNLIKFVDESLDNYEVVEPARRLVNFVDELSNWYLRRSRERFWAADMLQDKVNAYMTLFTVLEKLTLLSAPFIPFMTEEIYLNLVKSVYPNAKESIHFCDFPISEEEYIDNKLEKDMDLILNIVVMGRSLRSEANIKNRQPVSKIYIKSKEKIENHYHKIILDELNIKEIIFIEDASDFTSFKFKPQLKTLGAKYGKLVPKIGEYLKLMGNDFYNQIKKEDVNFTIENENVTLSINDLLIEEGHVEGFKVQTERDITVVLDTKLTKELLEEGYVREIISKVQNMRKEAELEVLDKIIISYESNDFFINIINNNKDFIKSEVLANDIIIGKKDGFKKDWLIDNNKITITISKS